MLLKTKSVSFKLSIFTLYEAVREQVFSIVKVYGSIVEPSASVVGKASAKLIAFPFSVKVVLKQPV